MARVKILTSSSGVKYYPGVIIVGFKEGTSQQRARHLVKEMGCKFQEGSDGSMPSNVVIVPKGKDEEYVALFEKLPEVESAGLNEDSGVTLL